MRFEQLASYFALSDSLSFFSFGSPCNCLFELCSLCFLDLLLSDSAGVFFLIIQCVSFLFNVRSFILRGGYSFISVLL